MLQGINEKVSPERLHFKIMHHRDVVLVDCWLDRLNYVGFEAFTAVIYEECFFFFGYNALYSVESHPKFWRNIFPPF
jgi:hypothetical protein